MELNLKSTGARAAFGISCLLLLSLFELCSLRQYLAYQHYESLTVPGLQEAMRLDPWNSEYAHLLGRIYLYQEQDFDGARTALRRALQLNRHNARYWLDLANVDQVTGDTASEENDLHQAQAVEPTMPQVSWEVANLYLLRGDLPKAFQNFATVEQNSPELRKQAIELSWRVQPNVDLLLPYLPRNVDTLSSFLQVLYDHQKLADAGKVWQSLISLHQPLDPAFARNYLSHLLTYNAPQVAQAQQVWSDFVGSNPEMANYVRANNLVVNGGFENDVLGWGFDWHYDKRADVSVAQENGVSHTDSRSLSVSFDGKSIQDFGIYQYVPVTPNTRYVLQAFVRADNILGSSGPRLAVTAPYDFSQRFYTSDDILGSTLWSSQKGSFSTGPDTHMVAIVLLRNAPYDPIKGHLWLDDVSLTREDSQ